MLRNFGITDSCIIMRMLIEDKVGGEGGATFLPMEDGEDSAAGPS